MISRVESCQTWLEHISEPRYFLEALPFNLDAFAYSAHQMCNMVGGSPLRKFFY